MVENENQDNLLMMAFPFFPRHSSQYKAYGLLKNRKG